MKLPSRHARITDATSTAGTIPLEGGSLAVSSDKQLLVLIILVWVSAAGLVSFIAGVMIRGGVRPRR